MVNLLYLSFTFYYSPNDLKIKLKKPKLQKQAHATLARTCRTYFTFKF